MALQMDFIKYWDEVIKQWLDKNAVHESFVGDAEEQHKIIEAINSSVEKNRIYKLNTDHMPEPYWGNPEKCSIVLLNYNPAGGSQPSPHTSISCKACTHGNKSFIHYVNTHSYSDFSTKLKGPVFRDKNDLKKEGLEWFTGYGGYGWWQDKCDWLNHLVKAKCGEASDKLPFGMELCGWHSEKWSNNMSWIDNGCRNIVYQRAIKPFYESLKCSSAQMAVCIGAEFKPSILKGFFNNSFIDVTQSVLSALKAIEVNGYRILESEEIKSKPKLGKESKESIGVAVNKNNEKETIRYYRVYNVKENEENHIILNTFAPGGNRHPAEHFWKFEDKLLEVIKNGSWKNIPKSF